MIDPNRFGQAKWGALSLSSAGKRCDKACFSNPMSVLDSEVQNTLAFLNALEKACQGALPPSAGKTGSESMGSTASSVHTALPTPLPTAIWSRSTAAAPPLSKPPAPVGILDVPHDLQLADGGAGAIAVSPLWPMRVGDV